MTDATYVPDGDPCPKPGHEGQPTRLTQVPGAGLFSQCATCFEDFLAWYSANSRGTVAIPVAAADGSMGGFRVLDEPHHRQWRQTEMSL